MLAPLAGKAVVEVWADTAIEPSQAWREEIDRALAATSIGVLLVSPSFLASDFIMKEELPYLVEAWRQRKVTLFWVLLYPCLYEQTPLADLQAVHDISRPIAGLLAVERASVLKAIGKRIAGAVAGKAPNGGAGIKPGVSTPGSQAPQPTPSPERAQAWVGDGSPAMAHDGMPAPLRDLGDGDGSGRGPGVEPLGSPSRRQLRERIEKNSTIWLITIAVAGFVAGLVSFKAILEIAQLAVVPKAKLEQLQVPKETQSEEAQRSRIVSLSKQLESAEAEINRLRASSPSGLSTGPEASNIKTLSFGSDEPPMEMGSDSVNQQRAEPSQTSGRHPDPEKLKAQPNQTEPSVASTPIDSKPPKNCVQIKERENIRFQLDGCAAKNGGIICRLTLTNRDEDRVLVIETFEIFDSKSREYISDSLSIADLSSNSSGRSAKLLIRGTAVPVVALFDNVIVKDEVFSAIKIFASIQYPGGPMRLSALGPSFPVSFYKVSANCTMPGSDVQ